MQSIRLWELYMPRFTVHVRQRHVDLARSVQVNFVIHAPFFYHEPLIKRHFHQIIHLHYRCCLWEDRQRRKQDYTRTWYIHTFTRWSRRSFRRRKETSDTISRKSVRPNLGSRRVYPHLSYRRNGLAHISLRSFYWDTQRLRGRAVKEVEVSGYTL